MTLVLGDIEQYFVVNQFKLSHAYPNPFNPSTSLDLNLDVNSHVNASVYNINGQLVDVILDKDMQAGDHNLTWNAQSFSSGLYFIRLQAGDNVAIQKLVLMK